MVEVEKHIIELIHSIAGKEVVSLIDLMGPRPVSEFKLAERLKETVNQVRNRLYKLHSHNLVDFLRKKDKRKGWYIYYWTFDRKKAIELALDFKKKKIEQLSDTLEAEKKSEYLSCKNDETRLTLQEAMEQDFRCLDCDELLVRDDNTKRINQIKKDIDRLNKDVVEIEDILEKEKEKELRKLERAKKKARKPKKKVKKKVKKKIKKKIKKKAKKKIKKKVKRKKRK